MSEKQGGSGFGKGVPFPLPPSVAGSKSSAFIGRDRELEHLHKKWVQVLAGQRRLVLLAGEAGIGKTRLASEFARIVHAEGATILFGHTDEEVTLPYQLFVEALRHYVINCPLDVLRIQMEPVGAELNTLIPEIQGCLPERPHLPQADPDIERHHLFSAFATLLVEASRTRPIVLLLDDLHWTDKETLLLLKHIVRLTEQSPLLIIGTYREAGLDRTHPLSDVLADLYRHGAAVHKIRLGGLDEAGVGALINARLGIEAPRELIHTIHVQTEGNPFFIEEVLHHLEEIGAFHQHDGRLMIAGEIKQIGIPESVKDVVRQRLARLSEECNGVLAVASVIGREFNLESLERASDFSGDPLLDLLEEAVAAHIVLETPGTVGHYRFSHALIHETLYEELTTTRRVRLHGQILQYADNSGVKLAYEVLGGGGSCIAVTGLSNCPSVRPRDRAGITRWDRISSYCRVILYDRRGVGFSAAPSRGYSLLASVEDLRAVLDAVGVGRVILWGATDGGPLAIAFAAQYPERVAALILAGTSPKLYNSEDFTLGINPAAMASFLRADASDPKGAVSQLTGTRPGPRTQAIDEVIRRVPPHAWSKIIGSIGAADARHFLSKVHTPTLIIHDPDNHYIPVEAAHYTHERIQGSRLEISTDYAKSPYGEALYRAIETFIKEVTTDIQKPGDLSNYHLARTREALAKGDLGRASLHAELAVESSINMGSSATLAMAHLTKAYVMHELGKHDKKNDHLTQALNMAREIKNEHAEFCAHWAAAVFYSDRDQWDFCPESLREALAIGRKRAFFDTFINQSHVAAKLCAKALEAEIEVEYVQDLIRKRDLFPDKPPLHLDNWPWNLKLYTLGRFRLEMDGKPVTFTGKTQQKPLAMLQALIAFGGRDVNEEKIAEALWPDAEGDMAHRSFATTLHRLRRLVGQHEAISLQRGCLTLHDRYCWVDARAFEHFISEADALWEKESPNDKDVAEAVQVTRKAIEIYRGPFLAGETEEFWVISARESLRSKFLRSVERLGRYREKVGQWNEAVECYQRGLEIDDLLEGLYRRLMVCYAQIGRKSEAVSVYERCKKVLSMALGIDPSPETEAMRESLFSEKNP